MRVGLPKFWEYWLSGKCFIAAGVLVVFFTPGWAC
jgi:hypothetical protein